MGALANAVMLLHDETFREWCMAASCYQARQVLNEPDTTADHAIRARMATDVLSTPTLLADRLVVLVGTDPNIAQSGSTVGDQASQVSESQVLSKVADVWTMLAQLTYPNG